MRYLMREGAPLSDGQWALIDKAVVAEAMKVLVGRRFLSLSGPVGAQVQNVPLDMMGEIPAAKTDFWGNGVTDSIAVANRKFVELETVYSDFMISWRDIENEQGAGVQAAMDAAVTCARCEDDLIFYGDKDKGLAGICTAPGVNRVDISDWNSGENPVLDVAKGLQLLVNAGHSGERALIVSTDLYAKLHRIQPGTGVMEVERVKGMVDGKIFPCSRLQPNMAVLVYCAPHNMDLVIGQDMITAYIGNEKLDHAFRVMETMVLRIKRPSAISVIG